MPLFTIKIDFDGEESEYESEHPSLEEAEWEASDRLRDLVYNRTSSSVEEKKD